MNCLSSCKSRIYNVRIIVIGDDYDVRHFIRDNRFINDLSTPFTVYNNSPEASSSRVRASRARGGMDTDVQKPKTSARPEE